MPLTKKTNPRSTEKVVIRLPDGFRGRIAQIARKRNVSMNSLIVGVITPDADKQLPENLNAQEALLIQGYRAISTHRKLALLDLLSDKPCANQSES